MFGWPGFAQNTAAKAALALITETLRLELTRWGAHVVEVIPGPIETPALGPSRLIPGLLDVVHRRMGTGQPDEVARMIVDAVSTRADCVFCPEAATLSSPASVEKGTPVNR